MSGALNPEEAFSELLAGLEQIPATLTIPIDPPVNFGGADYAHLVLREPTVDEVRQAEEQLRFGRTPSGVRNYEIHLVSKCSGVPLPVIQKIGVSRILAAMAYISIFLGVGRGTGAN